MPSGPRKVADHQCLTFVQKTNTLCPVNVKVNVRPHSTLLDPVLISGVRASALRWRCHTSAVGGQVFPPNPNTAEVLEGLKCIQFVNTGSAIQKLCRQDAHVLLPHCGFSPRFANAN